MRSRPLRLISLSAIALASVLGCGTGKLNPESSAESHKEGPVHPVTARMELETKALANLKPGAVTLTDSEGKMHLIASDKLERPQYLLFIKDGCPCSVDAQPIFNDLSKKFAGKIEFYGVIETDVPKAKKFAADYKAAFPILADPEQKLIGSMKAKGSVYNALIVRNGHAAQIWPGYSRDMLVEINGVLSKAAGVPVTPFDSSYAPVEKTSGCEFEAPLKSQSAKN